jgi:hypothetical protein
MKLQLFILIISLLFPVVEYVYGQDTPTTNPPYPSNNPYTPRGDPQSPDGRYGWVVSTTNPVRYELLDTTSRTALATLESYFADSGGAEAVHYAQAYGVYWNKDSSLVALDELNYRRAGKLYFFALEDGKAKPINVDQLIPIPINSVENRLCADRAWISPLKFSVRLAMKLRNGEFKSKFLVIDFSDADHPTVSDQN